MGTNHQTKGIDLIGLVKTLKAWRKANPGKELPGLTAEDLDFLDNTLVLPVGWYPHDRFLRFLDAVSQLVFGGSQDGMLEMGRMAARETYTTVHSALIYKGDVARTLSGGIGFIKAHFDFGEWTFEEGSANQAHIRISGYPEMTETHGTLFVGWCEVMIELSGGEVQKAEVLEAPWRGDGEYLLALAW